MARRKAVGYLRVSTTEQAEKGDGLGVQEDQVRAHCRAVGLQLLELHVDEGESGSNGLDTRMALSDAMAALSSGDASVLVVPRLDRLARDLVLQETLLAQVWSVGADVQSTARGEDAYLEDDPDDPSRRLIRQVLGAVAEYERAMIRLRMRAGRRRKAAAGGYVGGLRRYGTDQEDGDVVALAIRLHKRGESYRSICTALQAAGHHPRRADRWQPAVVRRMVLRAG